MNANDSPAESTAPAPRWRPWQPFTFPGVARFADGALWRIVLMEVIVAAIVAVAVVRFIQVNYAPVILEAIQQMPDSAAIQNGQLIGIPETLLSETKLIAIAVTPDESTDIGQASDFQLQFRQNNFRVGAVFEPDWGLEFDYGSVNRNLNRATLEPYWGAWHPVFFAGCGAAVMIALAVVWTIVALIYSLPIKIAVWFADRRVGWPGAFKIASAALMPGSALLVFALFLYGSEKIDLIGLACFYAGHLILGWVYIAGSIRFLERPAAAPVKNPFKESK